MQVHTLSFPVDQMVAFTALSYGGVLDRLPTLRVAFLEAPDSAVFASDYPHWDTEFPGTVAEVRERHRHLGDDVLNALLGGNALRLYGLDGAAA